MNVENLSEAFQKNFSEGLEVGAAVALYRDGKSLLSLHSGWCDAAKTRPWQVDTPALIWSASKGIAAACLLHALQEEKISLDQKVSHFWPEFGKAGKNEITIAQLVSHRAGLAALDQQGLSLTDHEAVVASLAKQEPNWLYDGGHGYGPRTFGFLVDELLRRIANGETLASYWRRIFAEPYDLAIWFGIPEELILKTRVLSKLASDDEEQGVLGAQKSEHIDICEAWSTGATQQFASEVESWMNSIADVIPPKILQPPCAFTKAFGDTTSLTRRAFAEPGGSLPFKSMNNAEMRTASIISLGAIATADALAKFYSILASDQYQLFTPSTRTAMQTTLADGLDRVLLAETSFSGGFMTNQHRTIMGPSARAFGHPGAGGSLAFADPENNSGFAYIPNAMQPGTLPGERTLRLVKAFYN